MKWIFITHPKSTKRYTWILYIHIKFKVHEWGMAMGKGPYAKHYNASYGTFYDIINLTWKLVPMLHFFG